MWAVCMLARMIRRGTVQAMIVAIIAILGALIAAGAASAASGPDVDARLIDKYSPLMRFGPGDECDVTAYRPVDVSTMFQNPEVVLRGPWDRVNIVKVAPTEDRVSGGLTGYHLDFPGSALRPADCVYLDFQESLLAQRPATIYGRIAREAGHPDKMAVQYWFFYVFNDWKNRHEGDWEMIQVEFDTGDAEVALSQEPRRVVYSQHATATSYPWDSGRVTAVDDTHPVVFVATGSHASFAQSGLFLARGGREGLGCDDARASEDTLTPVVQTIPSDSTAATQKFPWLGFDGRWGELRPSFFNGPTGPRDKLQYDQPFTWSEHRDATRSASRIPSTSVLTTPATDAFCYVIGAGAVATRLGLDAPTLTAFIGVIIALLVWFAASRTRWTPSAPRRLNHTRSIGQILTASFRMYKLHPGGFFRIGLIAVPMGLLGSAFDLAAHAINPDSGGGWWREALGAILLWLSPALPILTLVMATAAVAWMAQRVDRGERPSPYAAYRATIGQSRLLLVPVIVVLAAQLLASISWVLLVLVVLVTIRICLYAVIVGTEGDPDDAHPLRGSIRLTRGNTWRTAVVAFGVVGLAVVVGPFLGIVTIILTGWPYWVINFIAMLVRVVTLICGALALTYLYADLRAREVLSTDEPAPEEVLPEQFTLPSPGGTAEPQPNG